MRPLRQALRLAGLLALGAGAAQAQAPGVVYSDNASDKVCAIKCAENAQCRAACLANVSPPSPAAPAMGTPTPTADDLRALAASRPQSVPAGAMMATPAIAPVIPHATIPNAAAIAAGAPQPGEGAGLVVGASSYEVPGGVSATLPPDFPMEPAVSAAPPGAAEPEVGPPVADALTQEIQDPTHR